MEIIAVVIFEQGNPDVGEHEVLVEIVEEFDNARVPNVLEDGWFGELRKHRSIVKSGEETAAGVPWFRPSRVTPVVALLGACWILGSGNVNGLGMKLALFSALFTALIGVEWCLVLDANDRRAIVDLFRSLGRMANGKAA